jgi:antitoxin ParD1/3/4
MLDDMRASVNISLPEGMKAWVEEQVARGGYGTVSEYFRQLLREQRQRQMRRQIDANLSHALESGDATPMTGADWEDIRRQARRRLSHKKSRAK